ncbi:MAG: ferredoxin [Pseudomonadota bacterium]
MTAAPEFDDGRPNPLDRWSRRTVGRLACDLGAKALFPFKGPPWLPFLGWAQRTGRFWTSPIGMLVHAEAGLLVSIRGALALREEIALPPPLPQPCDGCPDKPCRTTCPVDAFTPDGYAVDRCRAWVASASGADCRNAGCRARRACPVSATYPRMAAQSAFHMRAFLEA